MLAKDFRAAARAGLTGNWGIAVLAGFIAMLLGGVASSGGSGGSSTASNVANNVTSNSYGYDYGYSSYFSAGMLAVMGIIFFIVSIYALISLVIGGAVRLGYCQFNMDLLRKDRPVQVGTLFSHFNIFGKAFLLNLLMNIFIALWSLLFIIPGIVASYRYAMAPYIMAQNPEIGVMDAINESKRMMQGNKGRLFCMQISFIGWSILAAFTCGIGFLFLTPYMEAAEASFYLELTGQLPGSANFRGFAPTGGPAGGYAPPPPPPPPAGNYSTTAGSPTYTTNNNPPPPPGGTYPPPPPPAPETPQPPTYPDPPQPPPEG